MFRAILRGSVKKGLMKRPADPFTPAYKAQLVASGNGCNPIRICCILYIILCIYMLSLITCYTCMTLWHVGCQSLYPAYQLEYRSKNSWKFVLSSFASCMLEATFATESVNSLVLLQAIGYTLPECNLMREPRPWQLPGWKSPWMLKRETWPNLDAPWTVPQSSTPAVETGETKPANGAHHWLYHHFPPQKATIHWWFGALPLVHIGAFPSFADIFAWRSPHLVTHYIVQICTDRQW